jgi:FKBP-type peptidyl-prolyl cis-trans isomerase
MFTSTEASFLPLRRLATLVPVVSLACTSAPLAGAPAAEGDLPRAEPGVLYSMGVVLAAQVRDYHLDDDEAREVARGLRDGAVGEVDESIRTPEMKEKVSAFYAARMKELARREELAGAFLLEQAEREPGAAKTRGGAVLRVIDPGKGAKPHLYDDVTVNYQGTLRDGTVFATNAGKPAEQLQLGVHTRCWQEALRAVAAGARIEVVCPPALGYGWGGWPGVVPPGAVLTYEIELVSIQPRERPPSWDPAWDE